MKQLGGVTYIGVSLKDLNKYFKDDAVIHISKKFLKSYEMISGITETPKPIAMNVADFTRQQDVMMEEVDKFIASGKDEPVEKEPVVEKIDTAVEPEREPAPPVELNVSKGDW